MHTAQMNINGTIRPTIIPPLNLYIDQITEQGVVSSAIEYRVGYDGRSFPFGHVYGQSGYLCLGNIPVPAFVSPYDLMNPLETLFLYNDRNLRHGGNHLSLSKASYAQLTKQVNQQGFSLTTPKDHPYDLLALDTIWDLGAQCLQKRSREDAYDQMEHWFRIIFQPENQ